MPLECTRHDLGLIAMLTRWLDFVTICGKLLLEPLNFGMPIPDAKSCIALYG